MNHWKLADRFITQETESFMLFVFLFLCILFIAHGLLKIGKQIYYSTNWIVHDLCVLVFELLYEQ